MQLNCYKVRWIMASAGEGQGGIYGTTTHEGATPAAAAIASAESVLRVLPENGDRHEFHILSVEPTPGGHNLLSEDDLRLTLRYHNDDLPIELHYRPLC